MVTLPPNGSDADKASKDDDDKRRPLLGAGAGAVVSPATTRTFPP